jgi:hypothetical protein
MTSRDPSIEKDVFGASEPVGIEEQLGQWCVRHLGSPLLRVRFIVTRLTYVTGLDLEDGRSVVVRAQTGVSSVERLWAVYDVQRGLARLGFPCPSPICPPTPLGRGIATAEDLVNDGQVPDPSRPALRDAMAETLARLLQSTRTLPVPSILRTERPSWINFRGPALWPPPHHPRLDFLATGVQAPWIDEIASAAKSVLLDMPDRDHLLGHADFEAQNMRASHDAITAVYDWDSLVAERAEVIVGLAAATHTAHAGAYPELPAVPTPEQRRRFVHVFERAYGRRFTATERRYVLAASAWVTAYNARVNHAFGWGRQAGPGSHIEALQALTKELAALSA